MKQQQNSILLVGLAGLTIALMGAWTMYQEVMPNLRGGSSAITRVASMPAGDAPIGLTVLSQRQALLDCEKTLRLAHGFEMRYLSAGQQLRLPGICAEMASGVVARSPADSLAWFIRAAAATAMNDSELFNTALSRSQLAGPHEGWIAVMRVELAEHNFAQLDSHALAQHSLDLQLVAASNRYRWGTARRFVRDADFRERMTEELETVDPTVQRSFLSAVRRILTSNGQ
ncbi:MAG: hypothetical protein ACOH2M_31540 [Cypionkella sp.]